MEEQRTQVIPDNRITRKDTVFQNDIPKHVRFMSLSNSLHGPQTSNSGLTQTSFVNLNKYHLGAWITKVTTKHQAFVGLYLAKLEVGGLHGRFENEPNLTRRRFTFSLGYRSPALDT